MREYATEYFISPFDQMKPCFSICRVIQEDILDMYSGTQNNHKSFYTHESHSQPLQKYRAKQYLMKMLLLNISQLVDE